MKAVIFNSGLGNRMGELTKSCHKSMVKLESGETIFQRQIRLLHECGIKEFVVTTGPFKEQLVKSTEADHLRDCSFTFVENPKYAETNYIYSMYLARRHLDDDILLLHGDLVFNKKLVRDIIGSKAESTGCVNPRKPLPEKDFKARTEGGRIREISINIFDSDCFAFQPFYKLSKGSVSAWLKQVESFIEQGESRCYAENALNEILGDIPITAFDYDGYYIDEVDTAEDLARVSQEIRSFDFDGQEIYRSVSDVKSFLNEYGIANPFLICGIPASDIFQQLDFNYTLFDNVQPNPTYGDICSALESFKRSGCDGIVSIGGGSAIDTAKCVKLYSAMSDKAPYIEQEYSFSPIKHIAIPSTAGTGSESTRFAVMYYKSEKQSITHDSIFPDAIVLDSSLLKSLPEYQKKSTMLDALCQGIESLWSVNSTDASKKYAARAVSEIMAHYKGYLDGNADCAEKIMLASNLAGRAINITQTTAAHAMSYKITAAFGISHGHAVAMCLPSVWKYMAAHADKCVDRRGKDYLLKTLTEISSLLGGSNEADGADIFEKIYNEFNLRTPFCKDQMVIEKLTDSVNLTRLRNNPVELSRDVLREMYSQILG